MISPLRRLAVAAVAAPMLMMAAASADARPFTARDLVTFERISDPQLSPDGRWVVYALRQTDYAANKGVNSLWIIDLKAPHAQPRSWRRPGTAPTPRAGRPTASGSTSSRPSPARSRSGASTPHGDAPGPGDQPALDVGAYQRSPATADRLAVSLAVFPDCADLACTGEARQGDRRSAPARSSTACSCATGTPGPTGPTTTCSCSTIGADGKASGEPSPLMRGFDGDTPSKPFGDDERVHLHARRPRRRLLRARWPARPSPGAPISTCAGSPA